MKNPGSSRTRHDVPEDATAVNPDPESECLDDHLSERWWTVTDILASAETQKFDDKCTSVVATGCRYAQNAECRTTARVPFLQAS